jgi:hypothetical protein
MTKVKQKSSAKELSENRSTTVTNSRTINNIRQHEDTIARKAYYKAQKRGFIPGFETQDWLEAEKEIEKSNEDTI